MGCISLVKSYLILQNCMFTAFTVSMLLRENRQEEGKNTFPQIRAKSWRRKFLLESFLNSDELYLKTFKIIIKICFVSLYAFMQTWFLLFSKLFTDWYAWAMHESISILKIKKVWYWWAPISFNVKSKLNFWNTLSNIKLELNTKIKIKTQKLI